MTRRVVLIGHPVAHSLSGPMLQAAFDERGIDARHELRDVSIPGLPAAIEDVRGTDHLGAQVTIPHKERVVPLIDRLTDEAHATGAVNTITKEGKRLVGHNTDVPGFRVALDSLVGRQKMPKQAVVLGAGGGARAVVYGLITEGFQRVVVFNRHLHRAEGLVRHFGRSAAHMELKAMPWHESIIEAELARTRVLVNATSIGLHGDVAPIPATILPPGLLVMDLIYNPSQTRFLREAAAAGAEATANGLVMLLHQGTAQFELWTGQPAPLEVMRERLEAALAAREASADDAASEAASGLGAAAGADPAPTPAPGD
ncbi:MAG: shikimate dehydrogenase [Candidatus Limnocylindrales bacterium]